MFNPGGKGPDNDDPFYLDSLQKNQEDQGIYIILYIYFI